MSERSILITALLVSTLMTFQAVSAQSIDESLPPKTLLIHLDGVSAWHLEQELKAGNLPNIREIFYPDGHIRNAITYLPSKTPMVIGSMRDGILIENSDEVSWDGVNFETGEIFSGPQTFRRMMRNKPRISVMSLLHGAPGLHHLNTIAFKNIPDLIREYRVLQYYWYIVDTYGHFFGEDAYLEKLRDFDRHLGRLVPRLGEEVNIIVYADHGMAFGEGHETDSEIRNHLDDAVHTVSYPHIYLSEPDERHKHARTVMEGTSVDFTFYQSGDNRVTGYHSSGTTIIERNRDRFRYSHDGNDPLGYDEIGYDGSWLNANEWLQLTYESDYPVAPPHIFSLLINPNSGSILTFLEEGKYSQTGYSRQGNHGGFTHRELGIPLLIRGSETEELRGRDYLYLFQLFRQIDTIDFDYRPPRSRHYLENWVDLRSPGQTVRVGISPYYRWAAGTEFNFTDLTLDDPDRFSGWIKYDLLRSYLARVWVGTGATHTRVNGWKPKAFVRHEFTVNRFTARTTLTTTREHTFALDVRVAGPVSIQVVNFNSAGLRLQF